MQKAELRPEQYHDLVTFQSYQLMQTQLLLAQTQAQVQQLQQQVNALGQEIKARDERLAASQPVTDGTAIQRAMEDTLEPADAAA